MKNYFLYGHSFNIHADRRKSHPPFQKLNKF